MVTEFQYTNIKRVLDNLLDHPMLRDLTLEQVVRHTMRFFALNGYPRLYQNKIDQVDIHEFRGLMPCDLVSIQQVRDCKSKVCLRAMTDTFAPGMNDNMIQHHRDSQRCDTQGSELNRPWRIANCGIGSEPSFKTQGRVIYTSFPEGRVEIAYRAIPTDEDGFPLLPDNEPFLNALEAYIKLKVFTVKFDTGKIAPAILQNTQKEYGLAAKELENEMTTPSVNEAEAMSRMMLAMIPRVREFDRSFKHAADREYLRRH